MTKHELTQIYIFKSYHSRCYTSDGRGPTKFQITLEATGVGEKVEIKCCGCNQEKEISDYLLW